MAQRSPLNERYQSNKPAGKTRKSASAAKPKRATAAPNQGSPRKPLSAREQAQARNAAAKAKRRADAQTRASVANVIPTDPAFKKWRTVWWILILTGVVMIGAMWLVRTRIPDSTVLAWTTLAVSYAAVLGALFVDFFKVRPMRLEAQNAALADRAKKGPSSAASASDK